MESNRAIAVSSIHAFIRLGPAFEVEDWYARSGGRRHLLSMIRSRWGTGRMNKPDGQDTADRLSAIVANSLDTQAKTQDPARQAYQSRTQFQRLFRTFSDPPLRQLR